MEMNRRTVLGASLALAATPILPRVAYASAVPIEWAPGALGHKFEALAGSWCMERLKEGKLYFQMDAYFDYYVKLTDPLIRITPGKPVWNYMTGYTKENGLAISISERGIPLCETIGIGTTIGYEDYWESPRPDNMPDYYVRKAHIPWAEMKIIEPRLPKDHMHPDMRWAEDIVRKA